MRLEHDGKSIGPGINTWFTVGQVYLVLGIHYSPGREASFWVLTDDRTTPVFKGASFFDIVDGTIPKNWIVRSFPTGGFEIIPIELTNGFSLEAFIDRKPDAVALFGNVVAKLEAERVL